MRRGVVGVDVGQRPAALFVVEPIELAPHGDPVRPGVSLVMASSCRRWW
jgi:hypothetical protein